MINEDTIWDMNEIVNCICISCDRIFKKSAWISLRDYSVIMRMCPTFEPGRDFICDICFFLVDDIIRIRYPEVVQQHEQETNTPF